MLTLIYKSFIHQNLVEHKKTQKTNLNKLNQRATCLQILSMASELNTE